MSARLRFLPIGAALIAAAALASPAMAASTYYASPTGSGTECSLAAPCKIEKAAEKGANGDSVVVEPGTYTLTASVDPGHAVSLGGQAGASLPVIQTTEANFVYVSLSAKASIHDLRIEGPGGLVMNSAAANGSSSTTTEPTPPAAASTPARR